MFDRWHKMKGSDTCIQVKGDGNWLCGIVYIKGWNIQVTKVNIEWIVNLITIFIVEADLKWIDGFAFFEMIVFKRWEFECNLLTTRFLPVKKKVLCVCLYKTYFNCPYSFVNVPLGWTRKLIVYFLFKKSTFNTEAAMYNDSPRRLGSL